ncbi:MAG TPA: MFS transporter [Micromonosporaceae bacterium]|nr:MFS transporter [Micromonosporaceae bacterium]
MAPPVLQVRDVGHRQAGVGGDRGDRSPGSGAQRTQPLTQHLHAGDFRLLWSANLVSGLGYWLLVIAAPAQVLTTTDSLLATGLVVAAQHLPSLALGPLAGILADRMNRRTLLVGTDLVRAAAIALLFTADTTPWMVHVAVLIESAATVVLVPAMQAHVPAVVGTGRTLSSANALNAANNGTVRLIGGPLGAALLLAAGFPAVVAIDAATYLVSAIAIALTRSRARPHPRGGRSSFRAGLQVLRGHPVVAALLPATGVFLLANAALSALLVPLGMQRLGGATAIGLVLSALGVGFLLGAPLLRLLVDRMPIRPLLSAAQAMTSVGIRRPGQRDRTTARAHRGRRHRVGRLGGAGGTANRLAANHPRFRTRAGQRRVRGRGSGSDPCRRRTRPAAGATCRTGRRGQHRRAARRSRSGADRGDRAVVRPARPQR